MTSFEDIIDEQIHEEMLVTITDRDADWFKTLKDICKSDFAKVGREYPHRRTIPVKFSEIDSKGALGRKLADELLSSPDRTLGDILGSIRNHHLIPIRRGVELRKFNVRVTGIPNKIAIRDIRAEDIGKFVSVEGILRKVTEVRPRVTLAVYRCSNGHILRLQSGYGTLTEPDRCSYEGCTAKRFELITKACETVDSQKMRIQESPEGLRGGAQPETLDVDVTDDITGIVNAGDRVVINGILRLHQRIVHGQKSGTFDIYLECNSIEISEKEFTEVEISKEDEEKILSLSKDPEIYEKIASSIAPSIYGMTEVKNAIALQLFGGLYKNNADGTRLRGDIHILMIGEPGIAKSQILRYVSKIAPRSIYTSGQSSSKAGLTATAVKDEFGEGRWTLEAGALVLADMGIACVDEIARMEKHDRSALHEAMEQQIIAISKAGLNATLHTRCSLLAAANPKYGRFTDFDALSGQIELEAPLLSRFDLIFLLSDKPERDQDRLIVEHISKNHIEGWETTYGKGKVEKSKILPEIDSELLRKYIAYSKRSCFPKLTSESKKLLEDFHVKVRSLADGVEDKPVPITNRYYEALIRLSEASARVRLSPVVTPDDATRAINLLDYCLRKVAYNPQTGNFDIDYIGNTTTKQTRDLTYAIFETIKAFGGDSYSVETNKVVSSLLTKKFTEPEIDKRIKALLKEGALSEPRNGILKVVT